MVLMWVNLERWWRPSWWWWGWCSWRGWCRYSNARCEACPAYTLVDRKKTALPDNSNLTRKIAPKNNNNKWMLQNLVKLTCDKIEIHSFPIHFNGKSKRKGFIPGKFRMGQVHKYLKFPYSPRSLEMMRSPVFNLSFGISNVTLFTGFSYLFLEIYYNVLSSFSYFSLATVDY